MWRDLRVKLLGEVLKGRRGGIGRGTVNRNSYSVDFFDPVNCK